MKRGPLDGLVAKRITRNNIHNTKRGHVLLNIFVCMNQWNFQVASSIVDGSGPGGTIIPKTILSNVS